MTHWVSVRRDVSHRKIAEEEAVRARIAEAERLSLREEIQERKRVEARLLYTAFHDDLTKLRNRAYFMNRLTVALDRVKAEPDFRCAVLFLDLDRFKLVNDSLGHRAGDLLLMEMAFVLAIARRIVDAVRRSIGLRKQEVFSSCSLGVVLATREHDLPEELLRDADIAMHQAKRGGTGGYAVFESAMHDSAVEAFRLQTDLQDAIARREFYLEYQPICHASTARLHGLEALVPSGAWSIGSERVHRQRRGDRPDPRHRTLGAARGLHGRCARGRSGSPPSTCGSASTSPSRRPRTTASAPACGRCLPRRGSTRARCSSSSPRPSSSRTPNASSASSAGCVPWACGSRWTISARATRRSATWTATR